ncbi:MAG: hypothetical protein N3H30_01470 [Candidatus Micrarchaeota archaeon]|nr:hypothetical protein [Candidatus Micrarchaeota archaeon]
MAGGGQDFGALRKKVCELERTAEQPKYTPLANNKKIEFDIRLLSFEDVVIELDKLYKVKAAKKYLKA